MSRLPIFIALIFGYILCARIALSLGDRRLRSVVFAAVNIVSFVLLTLSTTWTEWKDESIFSLGPTAIGRHIALIAAYVGMIAIGYIFVRNFALSDGWRPWIAFFYPIALLVGFKYLFIGGQPLLDFVGWESWMVLAAIIGMSYMAFRLSYLVLEVRNRVAEVPTLSEYLGFAFFLPTMVVGPINPFSKHQRSFLTAGSEPVPVGRALLRILVGATKYFFLANIVNQLTYAGMFQDGKMHTLFDLGVAVIFYYLFLFLNFSGFCDMAIGLAGLLGIHVKENFNNPFIARNVKEFWNRWHITLSEYTRDVVFAPVTKGIVKLFGPKYTNFGISVGVTCVFLVIGIWHGIGWLFILFGLVHAAGVIGNHYYTIWLKRAIGKEKYKKYNENRLVNAAAIVLTFMYVAGSFIFFANSAGMLRLIRRSLLWEL